MNINYIPRINYQLNIKYTNHTNNYNMLNDYLFKIKKGNFDDNLLYNTFVQYLKYIKKFNMSEEEEKIGFINLFFEKVFWIKYNKWKPITPFSFFIINYLGIEDEEYEKILMYLSDNLKKYKISENIFYIGENKVLSKIILHKILNLLSLYKKGGRNPTSEELINLNLTTNNVDLIHNFQSLNNILPTNITRRQYLRTIFRNIIKKHTGLIIRIDKFFNGTNINQAVNRKLNSSSIETEYYKFIQQKNFIHNNAKILEIKNNYQLIIEALSLFLNNNFIIINDANGLQNIMDRFNELIEPQRKLPINVVNGIEGIITCLGFILNKYKTNISITVGMIIDPSKISFTSSNYTQIYTDNEYNNILLSFFNQFTQLQNRIKFDISNIQYQKILILKIKKNINEWIDIKLNLNHFNTKIFIHHIIQYIINLNENRIPDKRLIDEYFITLEQKNIFKEYQQLIILLYNIFSGLNLSNINQVKNELEKYTENKIHILKIIDFITKFKLMGDQIQAIEADNTKTSLFSEKRLLTTQDRVLLIYCLTHPEVYFVSKALIDKKNYFFYNY